MLRKLLSVLAISILVLTLTVATSFAINGRVSNSQSSTLRHYGFSNQVKVDQPRDSFSKPIPDSNSLGAYASDGGSPGYIIGRSWRDDQAHINPGNFVEWSSDGRIHFIYAAQACAGYSNPNDCARWINYTMFDPINGVLLNGAAGIAVQPTPLSEAGHFPQMAIDETDHIIVAGEALYPSLGANWAPWTKMWWDVSPTESWGTFIGDTLPMTRQSNSTALRYQQPRIAYQEYNGQFITHVVSLFGVGEWADTRESYYHRKVSSASGTAGTGTSMFLSDSVWSNHYDLSTSRDDAGVVVLAWVEWINNDPGNGARIYFMKSTNAGETWTPTVDIVALDPEVDGWSPWIDCNVHVDSDGSAHVVWNAGPWINGAAAGNIDPARMFHWTDRVAGPHAGGTTSIVDILDYGGLGNVDCHGSSNMHNNAKPVISECNGRLYVLWQQFGNPDFPDDCAADAVSDGFRGAANSDIYMNVSLSLDGSLWDFRRDLTNTHTPGCEGTDDLPCDHDAFPSVANVGMNTAAVGTTDWTNVPEAFQIRDALDNSWPNDGYYIDVQYVNDLLADVARYMDEPEAHWTNNPIKWFRLPCVPPVIEPRIYIETDPFVHPLSWVQSGTSHNFDVIVTNIGNDDLVLTNVSANYLDGSGWVQINTTSASLAPFASAVISLTLNPGGTINPTGTDAYGIEAWIYFDSNDPNRPRDSLHIRSVIAQEVVRVTSDVI